MSRLGGIVRSRSLFDRACAVLPGGVNSPVRAFYAVGGSPVFIASAHGAHLTDVDGNRYVDLVCSWGAVILGHAHAAVVDAVQSAAARGTSFGAPTEAETLLAEEICGRCPSVERLRLVNSGTEAVMSVIRLARAVTGRTRVLKFAGCYHGHVDSLLADAGSGVATLGLPAGPGVGTQADETVVVPYNDEAAVRAAFAAHGPTLACVVTEAAPGNMGVVPPAEGFTALLAALCREHGALLISDEVMTGFRLSPAGWYGLEGVPADLYTFGKVMGGGLPMAAFGGRAELMDRLAPAGPVYQAGTLSGNPVATAAGLAVLRHCDAALYAHLDDVSARVRTLVHDALDKEGVPHQVQNAGNLFSVFFTSEPVGDYAAARQQHLGRFRAFFHAMLEHGVHLPPSAFEAWFLSGAHDDAALEQIADALPYAARAAAAV